ncbi:hypothetical protein N787_09410 [Arenimonas metalli CF5-1]|uniref:DUF4426 domain-containing protein n=2 Tax=Arenimonas TaxID=490567 RepID=A0A091B279_9GAMM|nr:hypothetical protein N787_09410 [Arenimonas metalli CF5-1]
MPFAPRQRLATALVAASMLFSAAASAQESQITVPDTSGATLTTRGVVASSDDKPGKGRIPAFVCLHTTLTDQGHTRQTTVIRKSGNPTADRQAQRVMQRMKIQDQEGVPHVEREIRVLVKVYESGAFAYQFFEMNEQVPEICAAPPWERKREP